MSRRMWEWLLMLLLGAMAIELAYQLIKPYVFFLIGAAVVGVVALRIYRYKQHS